MTDDEIAELYRPGHEPSDIVKASIEAAKAATAHLYKPSLASRISWAFLWFILAVGSVGAALGTLNTMQQARTNADLRHQQACLTGLLTQVQANSVVNSKISSDDRAVLDNLVTTIATAQSPSDVRKAFEQYKQQRAQSDRNRASLLVTLPNPEDACSAEAKARALAGDF